jgi:hypothetical protein
MMLLSPLILIVIFGSMLLTRRMDVPGLARPLLAFGAMAMTLINAVQMVGNQFGFDRAGFRVFVLCPARRRDILLGKNLAFAPLALGMTAALIVVLQVLYPLRLDHLLATLPQFVGGYLLVCLLANWLSILTPMAIAQGSMRSSNAKLIPVLLRMACVFLFPLLLAPLLLPLGVEALLDVLAGWHGVPVNLLLSLLECAGIVWLYRAVLDWQGTVLQARERRILKVVAGTVE